MPIKIIKNQEHIFVFSHKNAYCIGHYNQKSYAEIKNNFVLHTLAASCFLYAKAKYNILIFVYFYSKHSAAYFCYKEILLLKHK
jgi:hypothetical protein